MPNASTVAATAAALSSRLVTSMRTAIALPLPRSLMRVGDLLRGIEVEVAEADVGPLLGEMLGVGGAHAAGGAGDQDVLALQAFGVHSFLPQSFSAASALSCARLSASRGEVTPRSMSWSSCPQIG